MALASTVIEESFTTRRFVGMDRPDDLASELEGRDEIKVEVNEVFNKLVAYLAEHPEQQQRLDANPELVPSAVEELLRYDSVTHMGRIVREPVTLNGIDLHPGGRVYLLTDSAGRDGCAFADPDRLDFTRQHNRHLTWGGGIHRCLGIHFARLMMRVEIEEFHRACPRYAVKTGTTIKRRFTHIPAVEGLLLVVSS